MKLRYKILFSIIFCSFFTLLCSNNKILAMSQEEAGKYIASFAINFFENYADQTVYSWDDAQRGKAYQGIKTSGVSAGYSSQYFTDKYAMDCVGWVSFVIHQSLGLGSDSLTFFGQPHGYGQFGAFYNGFSAVSGNPNSWNALSEFEVDRTLQPGDLILATTQHILIYVGNNEVIHCTGGGPGRSHGGNLGYGIVRNTLDELRIYCSMYWKNNTYCRRKNKFIFCYSVI